MLPQANSLILRGEAGQLNLYVSNPRTSYVLSEFMNCSWFDINQFRCQDPCFSVACTALSAKEMHTNMLAAGCSPLQPRCYFAEPQRSVFSLRRQQTFELTRCKISGSYNHKTYTRGKLFVYMNHMALSQVNIIHVQVGPLPGSYRIDWKPHEST